MAEDGDEDRIDELARQLDEIWHETLTDPRTAALSYFVGMAAIVAAEEADRARDQLAMA